MIDGKPADPSGEALVEPEFAPPVHGDKIAEPLVSKLVRDDVGHSVAVAIGGGLFVEENGGGSAQS